MRAISIIAVFVLASVLVLPAAAGGLCIECFSGTEIVDAPGMITALSHAGVLEAAFRKNASAGGPPADGRWPGCETVLHALRR